MWRCKNCDKTFDEPADGNIPTYVPYSSGYTLYCYNSVCPHCGADEDDFEEYDEDEDEEDGESE
jgi:rubredoxin